MDIEKVVQNIQYVCREKGTTPTAVGKESGAGKDLVSLMKTRGSWPSTEKIIQMADYLDVSLDYLLGRTDEKKEPTPVVEDGLDAEHRDLVSLYDAASPALRTAALAVLRSAGGQVMETESDQAAALPEMLETVELEGIGTIQIKKMEPWNLSGSAKRQESGTVTEQAKPQKSQYVFSYNTHRPKSRRKDRMKKLAELLETAQSTKGPGDGH